VPQTRDGRGHVASPAARVQPAKRVARRRCAAYDGSPRKR